MDKDNWLEFVVGQALNDYLNVPESWIKCEPKTRVRFFIRRTVGLLLSIPVMGIAVPFLMIGLPLAIIGKRLMWCCSWLAMDFEDDPKSEQIPG